MERQRRMLLLSLLLCIPLVLCGCGGQQISPERQNFPKSQDGIESDTLPDVDPLPASQADILDPDDESVTDETQVPTLMPTMLATESSYPVTDQGAEEGIGSFETATASTDKEQMTQALSMSATTSTTTKTATTTRSATTAKPATTTTPKETTKATTSQITKASETITQETTTSTKTATTKKEATGTVDRTETDKNYKYMGNRNSKILHLTTCDSASRTSMANRVYFETREEAIEKGYKPCSRCKP